MSGNLTKNPEGLLEKTRANLTELIDRYIPLHTREEVWEMQRHHEERVWDLLNTIHQYRERNQQMAERMVAMEKEYYAEIGLKVPFGSFTADSAVNLYDQVQSYRITWRPDAFRAETRVAYRPLDPNERPYLFEVMCRQFKEHVTRELIPRLEHEYAKLYATENYR